MKKNYYPLDLSALAYPMMQTRRTQSNFRYSATLTEPVRPEALSSALQEVLSYYPNFKAQIKNGLFWNKLEPCDAPVPVKEDASPPLSPFKKEDTNGYPFRLAYKGAEIVLEVFHAVTDGNVGAFFLSDVLTRYAEIVQQKSEKRDLSRGLTLSDAFIAYGKKKSLRKISLRN